MAKKKLSVPKKRLLSCAEAANVLGEDIDYVWQLFEEGKLIPRLRLPDLQGMRFESTMPPRWGDPELVWDWDGRPTEEEAFLSTVWSFSAIKHAHVRFAANHERYFLLDECFLDVESAEPDCDCWFLPTGGYEPKLNRVNSNSLLIDRDELIAFISEQQNTHSVVGTRNRRQDSLLLVIGVLTRRWVRSETSPPLGTEDKVNRSAVGQEIHRYMETHGMSVDGLKSSNLDEILKEGLELFEEQSVPRKGD